MCAYIYIYIYIHDLIYHDMILQYIISYTIVCMLLGINNNHTAC